MARNTWMIILVAGAMVLAGCTQQPSGIKAYVKGQLAAEHGHTAQAIAELSKAISRNPQMALAYQARADLYRKSHHLNKAADDYQHVTRLDPYNFHSFFELGRIYQQLQKFEQAISAYQHALQLQPGNTHVAMNLAVAYAQAGHPFRGILYGKRAVDGGRKDFAALANLGAIYAQAAAKDAAYRAKAINYLKQSLELQPHQPRVYLNLAQVYLKAGEFTDAGRVLRTSMKLAPSALASERLGYCYYKLHNLQSAKRAYLESLTLKPNYPPALNGLGVVSMTQSIEHPDSRHAGRLSAQAIKYWKASLKVNPNQPLIQKLVKRFSHHNSSQ